MSQQICRTDSETPCRSRGELFSRCWQPVLSAQHQWNPERHRHFCDEPARVEDDRRQGRSYCQFHHCHAVRLQVDFKVRLLRHLQGARILHDPLPRVGRGARRRQDNEGRRGHADRYADVVAGLLRRVDGVRGLEGPPRMRRRVVRHRRRGQRGLLRHLDWKQRIRLDHSGAI